MRAGFNPEYPPVAHSRSTCNGGGRMKYDRMVIGYHGCDESVARAILAGETIRPSENDYDWLGHGIYFWEFGLDRAIEWSNAKVTRNGGKAAVIGAVIQTGNCFDLLDTRYVTDLKTAYWAWSRETRGMGLKNNGLARRDCAFLNWYFRRSTDRGVSFDTVRGAFLEGKPLYPTCGFFDKSHIQIAVRNPKAILGVFRANIEETSSFDRPLPRNST